MTIRCSCMDPDCKKALHFEESGIWMTDCTETVPDHLMYMDANAIIKLIKEAKEALMKLARVEGEQ